MFGSSILEVAIGLVFVYLLLSLICSAVNEIIEAKLKNRATDLERGICELFNEKKGGILVTKFYNHPLIKGLFEGSYRSKRNQADKSENNKLTENNVNTEGWLKYYLKSSNLPSYIPAGNFAFAVMDILLHNNDDSATQNAASGVSWVNPYTNTISIETIRSAINGFGGNTEVQRALRTIAEQSGGDVNKMRENIEAWFNSSMDRVSGWYTRRTKWIILVMGLTLTIGLNVNSITIVKSLSNDNALRNAVVAQAEKSVGNPNLQTSNFKENKKQLEELGLPIVWDNFKFLPSPFNFWQHLLFPLIGWLLTAAAISLGAPFWFDVLNKFMVIRSTVKPHEKSPEESSEDRQTLPNQAPPTLTTATKNQTPETSSSTVESFQPQEWNAGNPQEGII